MNSCEQLLRTLRACEQDVRLIKHPDGSRLVLLARGGRVAALFSKKGGSCLWLHPALSSLSSARLHFQASPWSNPGGGRVWLAPEIDLFFPHYPDLRSYQVPSTVDPGRYQFRKTRYGCGLVNEGKVRMARSGRSLRFRISQSFGPAENPSKEKLGVVYAGFTQRTSLELLESPSRIRDRLGLWHLLQLPHTGEVWISVRGRVRPVILFSNPKALPCGVFRQRHRLLIHRTVRGCEYKVGLPPRSVTGRIGYLGRQGSEWVLVVRGFSVDSRGHYVDVPWRRPRSAGAAVQFCGVDSPTLGRFAEIEHHGPSVGRGTGRRKTVEVCHTWAYRGERKKILQMANALLDVGMVPMGD